MPSTEKLTRRQEALICMLTHRNLKSMLTELGIGFTGINAHFLAVQMHVNAESDADRPVHDIRDPRYDSIDASLLENITAYVVQPHICYLLTCVTIHRLAACCTQGREGKG